MNRFCLLQLPASGTYELTFAYSALGAMTGAGVYCIEFYRSKNKNVCDNVEEK